MAKQPPIAEGDFALAVDWPGPSAQYPHASSNLNDLSFGRLTMSIAGANVTAWRGDNGSSGEGVELGLYHLAEWIALNWWALLHEPKKGDSADSDEYRFRHWFGTARNGFALPDLWLTPAGPRIEITAEEQYLRSARLSFLSTAACTADRTSVETQLAHFVDATLERISAAGRRDTIAHEAWDLVRSTDAEQAVYCRLVGSLGLSPYDENPQVDEILDAASEILSPTVLADMCQATDVGGLKRVADLVSNIVPTLAKSAHVDLSEISEIPVPPDTAPKPWRRGTDAANRVREHFGLSARDPHSADAFLGKMNIDTSAAIILPRPSADNGQISAAIQRLDRPEMLVSLIESGEPQRRFTAARAVFLGWLEGHSSSRLVTGAKTRDQQASRAFAAEMLAPYAYIRSRSGSRSSIRLERVNEIADELGTSSAVVRYQAENNHIRVTD